MGVYPKEGVFARPSTVALAKNRPNQDLGSSSPTRCSDPTPRRTWRTFYSTSTNAKTVLVDGSKFSDWCAAQEFIRRGNRIREKDMRSREMKAK
jgi:hypothetical protein